MLTEEEQAFVDDLDGIGMYGMANLIRQRGLIRLLHDMGLASLLREPTPTLNADGEK